MAAGSARAGPDFGPLAATYDRLRPADAAWHELLDVLVAEGGLLGRRVLDLGCGTGQLALALAERGASVWGVDPSVEMLARAREKTAGRVALERGRAEELPFGDGSFERAVARLVVHLLDRPRALAEVARVLAPGGRLVVATFAPETFARFWAGAFFPSVEALDRARFPDEPTLVEELRSAGFRAVRARRLSQRTVLPREEALERIRGRFISTLRLLDEDEYREGLARAERELPDEVTSQLEWLVVAATRP